MGDTATITTYGALFVAGLAGSLHCVGMCGPIVVGFTQVFEQTRLTVGGKGLGEGGVSRWRVVVDLGFYHLGRIWTYALLGFIAGLGGVTLKESAAFGGFQAVASVAISVLIILTGVVMLDVLPFFRLEKVMTGCGFARFGQARWFKSLVHSQGFIARFMLGVVMGFLPCGLVYMMLAATLALPGPGYSALGMVVFGLGTLPSLTAAVVALKMVPVRYRMHSTRVAAVLVIVVGGWMMYRSVAMGDHCHDGGEMHHVQAGGGSDMECKCEQQQARLAEVSKQEAGN